MADGTSTGRRDRFSIIEKQARCLQLQLWNTRDILWKDSVPTNPLEILQPGVALRAIGYEIKSARAIEETSLQGNRLQIAGELDPQRKIVRISSRFPADQQAFTAAHELGHIVLNHSISNTDGTIHRDRPLPELGQISRSPQEREADWFATCFLMPQKQVVQYFERQFRTRRFVLDDDTAFALCAKSFDAVRERCRSLRGLTLMLASANIYGGVPIAPLHKIFGVSRLAMAVRLEQTGLVGDF